MNWTDEFTIDELGTLLGSSASEDYPLLFDEVADIRGYRREARDYVLDVAGL